MVMMQPAVAPETEAEIGRCYSTIRAKTPDGMSITVESRGCHVLHRLACVGATPTEGYRPCTATPS
jgi:hypothetical protein